MFLYNKHINYYSQEEARMVYLSHISEDHRQQTVLQHLEGTAELCSRFAASFGAGELG